MASFCRVARQLPKGGTGMADHEFLAALTVNSHEPALDDAQCDLRAADTALGITKRRVLEDVT